MSEITRTIVTRIQNKCDSKDNWAKNDPVLLTGELGFESDTGNFKIGRGEKHWKELPYASVQSVTGGTIDEALYYSNSTPIVSGIGSIKPGDKFENKSIQEMLDLILYPYIWPKAGEIYLSIPAGDYVIPNYPMLNSVSLYIEKNSATNFKFTLWHLKEAEEIQLGVELTESDIHDNILIFSNLNYTIDVDSNFVIRYSYTGESGKDVSDNHVYSENFVFKFVNPTFGNLYSNFSREENNYKQIEYYVGEEANATEMYIQLSRLNSAREIKKLELYRDNTLIKSIENPNIETLKYIQTIDGLNEILTSTSRNTTDYSYRVRIHFDSRTGKNTSWTPTFIDSSALTVRFTYKPAEISLINLTSKKNISRLLPQTIAENIANVRLTSYSDKITSVVLFENGTSKITKDISSDSPHNSSTYSDFSETYYSGYHHINNFCDDLTLQLKAYNDTEEVATSNIISYEFYSPNCFGFIDFGTNEQMTPEELLNRVTLDTIETLEQGKYYQNMPTKVFNGITCPVVSLSEPESKKRVVVAFPNGNYKKVYDVSTGFEITDLFTVGNKTITFADNTTTQNYQIFILTTDSQAPANYRFE